ncbi:hypothetical protein [Namhaeicola litoreus]|uniref:DUF3300 domain-containing protein n=1 Tax=Namhaeicola litoreus TaxID=1052145 RepID=A0ABW3Y406_9FLAO
MKIFQKFLFPILLFCFVSVSGQDVTTIEAANADISDNLDLEAVASIFGESKDIEDFERRLNDPKIQINNLDLNNDGEVDYLRVMETASGNVHTLSIESVLAKDQYQQVATIDVVKDKSNKTQVQVVGNVDMYGPNYYINPVYPVVPVFFTFFWMATYRPWYSPWYWGYHPPYWNPWRPYSPYAYRSNVHVHINIHNTYNYNNVRINNSRNTINNNNNSYFRNNPNQSFDKRNPGVSNRAALADNRKQAANRAGINNKSDLERVARDKGVTSRDDLKTRDYQSTGRPVTKPNNPSSQPATRPSTSQPSARPSTGKPTTNQPSARPATRPSTNQPSARPSTPSYQKPTSSRPSYSRPKSAQARPAPRPQTTRAATPKGSYRRR